MKKKINKKQIHPIMNSAIVLLEFLNKALQKELVIGEDGRDYGWDLNLNWALNNANYISDELKKLVKKDA